MTHRFEPILLALAIFLLAGCERPFVELNPPDLELLSPDLTEVLTTDRVQILVRADAVRSLDRVELNGRRMTFQERTNLWVDTLILVDGLNEFIISAFDMDDGITRDTLQAFYLPYAFVPSTITLPEPLGGHTTTLLRSRDMLITGGASAVDAPASSQAYRIEREDRIVVPLESPMIAARTGHTASILEDGRVLIVGGSTDERPESTDDLVEIVELYDPELRTFTEVPVAGEPIRITQHSMALFTLNGPDVLVYLFGGIGPVRFGESELGVLDDLSFYVFRNDSLLERPPSFNVVTAVGHSQTLIQNTLPVGSARYLVAGTDFVREDVFNEVFFELNFSTTVGITETPIEPFHVPRAYHASERIALGLVGIFGGRSFRIDGAMNGSEVYVAQSKRFLKLPEAEAMDKKRWNHTATIWENGRILLLGGFDENGQAHNDAEWFDVVTGPRF